MKKRLQNSLDALDKHLRSLTKEEKYIRQTDDYTCRLITLLNAHIHKFGHSPIEYGTKEYFDYFKRVDKEKWHEVPDGDKFKTQRVPCGGIPEAYELCRAKYVPFNGTGKNFKKWVYKTIADGNYIDFSSYVRNLHSFLVAEYNENHDTFMVINSGIYSEDVVNWLPLPILMKSHYSGHDIKGFSQIKFNNIIADSAAIIFD